jgi:hypothetical protein
MASVDHTGLLRRSPRCSVITQRAKMLFTSTMPTHAEKNRGRRVLFPLLRANLPRLLAPRIAQLVSPACCEGRGPAPCPTAVVGRRWPAGRGGGGGARGLGAGLWASLRAEGPSEAEAEARGFVLCYFFCLLTKPPRGGGGAALAALGLDTGDPGARRPVRRVHI